MGRNAQGLLRLSFITDTPLPLLHALAKASYKPSPDSRSKKKKKKLYLYRVTLQGDRQREKNQGHFLQSISHTLFGSISTYAWYSSVYYIHNDDFDSARS